MGIPASCRALVCALFSLICQPVLCADAGQADVLDPRALPLGDGRISGAPKRGHVFACDTAFPGGGAQRLGSWVHGTTWDETAKLSVQGDVRWPEAQLTISVLESERRVAGNGLPRGHATGRFPVGRDDPALAIDRNPNSIRAQTVALSLPRFPSPASRPHCVPMGLVGVALEGVAIFNALDAGGRDAVAHEVQDRCNGHPEREGRYHYHGPTPCLPGARMPNTLVGYALDGFGIYSGRDERSREITNADLDECHGRVSRVVWDGREVDMYHYVMTREYPYTIGCFRGAPAQAQKKPRVPDDEDDYDDKRDDDEPRAAGPRRGGAPISEGRGTGPVAGRRGPPPEAIAACSGQSDGSPCRFTSPRGDTIRGACGTPGGALACVPSR
jgi:hypothetical protein